MGAKLGVGVTVPFLFQSDPTSVKANRKKAIERKKEGKIKDLGGEDGCQGINRQD